MIEEALRSSRCVIGKASVLGTHEQMLSQTDRYRHHCEVRKLT